jgi:CRISPR-associated protein (TIGR03984 family)
MSGILRMFRCEQIALVDALAALAGAAFATSRSDHQENAAVGNGEPWWALVYTPDRCGFAVLRDGSLLDHDDQPWPLSSVFEARVFNAAGELRWVHEGAGFGRAALVTARPLDTFREGWEPSERAFLDALDGGYLLWGKADTEQVRAGWTSLFEARIGELQVPLAPAAGVKFLRLKTIEYLGQPAGDDFGNVRVIEEQLTGFERHQPKTGS